MSAVTIGTRPSPPPRSSTSALSLLSKIKSRDLHHSSNGSRQQPRSQRSTSLNTTSHTAVPRSSLFSLPPQEGAGVKARRLSTQPPDEDDFVCEVIDLDSEFVSASKLGRAKKCGSGASAACVKIMVRRAARQGPQFAVKEFRKHSAADSEAEFVAKVKSEFTIAKALNHPNVVKTVCLATHHGRWNHVMEYCAQGDVFGLLERNEGDSGDNSALRLSKPGVVGSKPYISPEVLAKDCEYDATKLDVWSCGILFLTLPLTNSQRRCLLRMLHPNPHQRCTIRDALSDRWVRAIECCAPDPSQAQLIDVSKNGCDKLVARMRVQPSHDHLPPRIPPKRSSLIQHRFDMGDGTSRYD
ncbi:hypothetical protein DV738_g3780, partial [Chaetothyriales sp. CBS 135597]